MGYEEDLQWAAGFAHAEDSFGFYFQKQRSGKLNGPYARLQIHQGERAPLDTFAQILGVGKVYGPYKSNGSGFSKPGSVYYKYKLEKSLVAQAIYCLLIEQPLTWDKIVGFWEGDGSGGFRGPYRYVHITFGQKNRKVLDEIRAFLGKGSIYKDTKGLHRLEIYDGQKELTHRLLEGARSPQRREQLERFAA